MNRQRPSHRIALALSYRYRLLPTKAQHATLVKILESQRLLYNAALEERIGAYRRTGRGRTYMDQCGALTVWRGFDSDARATPLNIQRWTLKRLDDAYAAFFRRVKGGGAPGFPRFRGKGWWRSFGFAEFAGARWDGKRLRFKGLPGGLRVHLHRPLPADLRSCVFTKDESGWSVAFHVRVDAREKCTVANSIGIDLGLKAFSYASDGVIVPNPRVARKAERLVRQRSRALARCKKGSQRRQKVRERLRAAHRDILNARTTWLHQQSAALVGRADLIAAEDLRIANMIKNPYLARSISDAGWAKFLSMVAYKAERAGKHFVTVDPRNTTQDCSGCGVKVPKTIAVRTHACPECGLVLDRDHNAALNILRAVAGPGQPNVAHQRKRAAGNLKAVTP